MAEIDLAPSALHLPERVIPPCHGLTHDAPQAQELLGEHMAFLLEAPGLN